MVLQSIILPAISYGFSAASMPGPLQAYMLNLTLRYGWRRGLLVIFSPLIVDGPVIVVTVFLLDQLPVWLLQGIRFVGGALLLLIAWGVWKQLRAGVSFTTGLEDQGISHSGVSPARVMGTAIAMNVFSPGPYLFWATINGPLFLKALDIHPLAGAGMLLSFYGTFLGGLAGLVLIFNRLGKISADMTRTLLLLTIGLLIWFGTGLIAEALRFTDIHRIISLIALLLIVLYGGYRRFAAPHPA